MMRRAEERGPSQAARTETAARSLPPAATWRGDTVSARPRKPERRWQDLGVVAWWVCGARTEEEVDGHAVAAVAVAAMLI
jgi:hypothetical protein